MVYHIYRMCVVHIRWGLTKGEKSSSIRGVIPDYIVGVVNGEGPPVPIPNTAVKLTRAENTWLVTARENR